MGLVCESWLNCTSTEWVDNHSHCQPTIIQDNKDIFLINITFIIVIGGIGNFLTIVSLPYCWIFHSKNLEIKSLWTTTTILILHLSFCDFLYCTYGLTGFFKTYYYGYYPHSVDSCWYFAAFRNWIAYADFISMAFIAVNRFYGMCTSFKRNIPPNNGQKIWDPLIYGSISAVLIWILALLVISPTLSGWFGKYGYDQRHGKCESMMCQGGVQAAGIIYTYGFFVPFLVIVASYTSIAVFINCIGSNLPKSQRQVDPARIGRTMAMLSFAYFLFTMPLLPFENMGPEHLEGYRELATLIAYSWYWWMYAVNFILYVVMLPRFRNAYSTFLKDVSNGILYILTCGGWQKWKLMGVLEGQDMEVSRRVAREALGIDLVKYNNKEDPGKCHHKKEEHNLAYESDN